MKTLREKQDTEERDYIPEENNEPGEIGYEYGEDAIEIDKGEGEKIVYGSTFSPKDGDLGDESEDRRDLPSSMRGNGHQYDPTLSTGASNEAEEEETDELKRGMRVVRQEDTGMAYGPDNYVDDDNK